MKKSSGSEFKQDQNSMNKKKTDVLDLDKYRTKKLQSQKETTEKNSLLNVQGIESKKPAFPESKLIRMDIHKKRDQNSSLKEEDSFEKEIKETKEKETQVIVLSDYRKRKRWKKDIFVNTAQVAGMSFSFLFLFMLMNSIPGLKGTESQNIGRSIASLNPQPNSNHVASSSSEDWFFEAPANKSIIITNKKEGNNRTPDSLNNPCTSSSNLEDPVQAIKNINPKNCAVKKL